MGEIAELEEAFKVASRSFEANQEGLLKELGLDARTAINLANPPIDRQVGGAGKQAQATRAELNKTMSNADAAIADQAAGGSGKP